MSVSSAEALPLSEYRRAVAACDRFEAAWRAGPRPDLADYLPGAPGADRAAQLRMLVAVELDLRRSQGERPVADEYRDRFPGDADPIDAAFAEAASDTASVPGLPSAGPPA